MQAVSDVLQLGRDNSSPETQDRESEKAAALRRLAAAGVDLVIPRQDCIVALNLSPPTISRMQRRNELPPFEAISPGRKGWRRSTLVEAIDGRRDWSGRV